MTTLALMALLVAPVFADVAASTAPENVALPPDRLYVGAKVGWFQPYGAQALYNFADGQGPRWDVDLLVEPSRYTQSVSLGGAFRPFRNALAIGVRARWLQLHAPWSRGYVAPLDNALALGAELGGRWALTKNDKLLVSLTLGGTASPWGHVALPPMITVDLGVGWQVMKR